ncbi:MAG: M48 family metallopeptidase [Gammaproteobacteria bacterium]|nr:M48 family metallopeptidase [Gammaproteobacteria bacterium]
MTNPMGWLFRIVLALVAAASLSACVTSPTGRTQLLIVPPDLAIVESARAYAATVRELTNEDKLLDDPRLAGRVRAITGRVVAAAVSRYPHTANWRWSVALIDEPTVVNAWCMAGGRMAVYSGLVERLALSDDELAHIMGHEIAHAVANHTAERMSVALLTQAGLIAAARAVDEDDGEMLTAAAVAARLALTLPNSRVSEAEADQMGIEFAIRAGYEPYAAVSLWRKMEAEGGARMPQFLSSHPSPANRREALAALASDLGHLRPEAPPPTHAVEIISAAKRETGS